MDTLDNKETVLNKDFETFRSEVSWFLKPNAKIEFFQSEKVRLTANFKNTFPKLTSLIENARQTHLTIDSQHYILFAWNTENGEICGWLNKQESLDNLKLALIEEHELLLKNIGGIQEAFNQPEESFSNNQNFMFIGSECFIGIEDWDDYYSMTCEEESLDQIDHAKLVAFAYEANGALTLYDPASKKVLLFSHDHCFDYVDFLENQPEYTFHTFKNAQNFTQYVEELASQWAEIIKVEP